MKTIEAVIEFAEVTITIFMLLRIKELEKKRECLGEGTANTGENRKCVREKLK